MRMKAGHNQPLGGKSWGHTLAQTPSQAHPQGPQTLGGDVGAAGGEATGY